MASFGDTYVTPNASPFEKATEFDLEYLNKVKYSLLGKKQVLKEVVKTYKNVEVQQPDGSVLIEKLPDEMGFDWQWEKDPNADVIMNDKGADYLIRQLRYIYNRPAALAEIINDDVVDTAGDTIERTFIHLILNDIDYGITNGDALLTEMNSILHGTHLYLKSMTNGGIKDWSAKTLSQTYTEDRSGQQQNPLAGIGLGKK